MAQVTRRDFDHFHTPNYSPQNKVIVSGKGSYVVDEDGKEYIDFAAGIAVNCLGSCHPELTKTLKEQTDKLWHASNIFINEPVLELAQKLTEATFAEKVFFANSGAEANEAALKIARRYAFNQDNNKNEIIAFHKGFHGRTFFTVSVGGKPEYSDGFGPKPAGIKHLPFNDISSFESTISDQTCAVILEPIQGEGGVFCATKDFLTSVRSLCDKHNALLIFDEIQTGVGRTGSLFAYMQLGVVPDILTTAKGLGGGFPIGAMLTTDKIGKTFTVGTHASTFGGNPLAASVANTVLTIINDTVFLESVIQKSRRFFSAINQINDRLNIFSDVRGMGLLVGAELIEDVTETAQDLIRHCFANQLLVTAAGPRTLRLCPPLNIEDEAIQEGLKRLEHTLICIKRAGKDAV
ncbi:acetylornithine/succinyldiaminopimelate transaminase [Marinobacter hydrocarbonoclasticus]|uniref:acetylornithine/succinyldiaminopimelate transaminase n=1 Tax=Marinobacter nauticus TaxID=2743 RepID=UPI001A8F6F6B|nr:acetylornithine/succinyldiaminopimelate transaminase [Marinobacter nauticus]MBN8241328.1 acetylornithine/succinyldiaminopimelate transaminase [Marinobacter nauticus]